MKTIAIKGKIIPMLITGLCFIFLASNSVIAQDKQPKNIKTVRIEAKEVKKENMAAKLTDDQKAKMKDLRIAHMKAMETLKAQNEELAAHLKTLHVADKPDTKAMFKTIDDMMANRGEIMKRSISFKEACKALLTPEQLKALELRGERRHMQMGGRNQNGRMQGNHNFGHGQMMQRGGMNRMGQMQRGGMNRPGQMMQRGQGNMFRGGMSPKELMINRQGGQGNGGQMMPQGQMQRRFQVIRKGRPMVSDSLKVARAYKNKE